MTIETWNKTQPHIKAYAVIDWHDSYLCKYNALVFNNVGDDRGDLYLHLGANRAGLVALALGSWFSFGDKKGQGVPVQTEEGEQIMVKNMKSMVDIILKDTAAKKKFVESLE